MAAGEPFNMAAGTAPASGPSPPPSDSPNVDAVLDLMNRTPLFMTELDDTDGAGGSNDDLEALKALAYEGTKAEVAGNFKVQGNECVKAKQWGDAREFYTRALSVLKGGEAEKANGKTGKMESEQTHWPTSDERPVVDLDEEREKEKLIEEACYVNRALCNLELRNYGSCNRDCASALHLNPRNIKAYYRSASACLSLDKLAAASDACSRAQALDPSNTAAKTLASKISARRSAVEKAERERHARAQRQYEEARTLQRALKSRGIATRMTQEAPADVGDAKMALADPLDESSMLSIPVLLLYPIAAQSDLIKAFQEADNLLDHFSYIMPCPWDQKGEYTEASVDCYMETASGGLAKVGKKVPLGKALAGGKLEVKDGLATVLVVPKSRAETWLADFKRRKT